MHLGGKREEKEKVEEDADVTQELWGAGGRFLGFY